MTTTLVVSDIHLDPNAPDRYAAFEAVLQRESMDHLWILGDLFEAWVGDDGAEDCDLRLLDTIRSLPCHVHWIPGNRDFLVGSVTASRTGWAPLASPFRFQSGLTVCVEHGDRWCEDDRAYQAFRAQVRTPQWQQDFLEQPLAVRREIARDLREQSQRSQANVSAAILDVTESAIEADAARHHAQLVIHGHTHRPALHPKRAYLRAVTSDWTDRGIGLRLHDLATETRIELVALSRNHCRVQATAVWRAGEPEWNLI